MIAPVRTALHEQFTILKIAERFDTGYLVEFHHYSLRVPRNLKMLMAMAHRKHAHVTFWVAERMGDQSQTSAVHGPRDQWCIAT